MLVDTGTVFSLFGSWIRCTCRLKNIDANGFDRHEPLEQFQHLFHTDFDSKTVFLWIQKFVIRPNVHAWCVSNQCILQFLEMSPNSRWTDERAPVGMESGISENEIFGNGNHDLVETRPDHVKPTFARTMLLSIIDVPILMTVGQRDVHENRNEGHKQNLCCSCLHKQHCILARH